MIAAGKIVVRSSERGRQGRCFVVVILISYQILFTDLSEQLSLFAMLRAIGYDCAMASSFVTAFLASLGPLRPSSTTSTSSRCG